MMQPELEYYGITMIVRTAMTMVMAGVLWYYCGITIATTSATHWTNGTMILLLISQAMKQAAAQGGAAHALEHGCGGSVV